MTKSARANKKSPVQPGDDPPVAHFNLDESKPKLKKLGGSNFDDWNNVLANQAMDSG